MFVGRNEKVGSDKNIYIYIFFLLFSLFSFFFVFFLLWVTGENRRPSRLGGRVLLEGRKRWEVTNLFLPFFCGLVICFPFFVISYFSYSSFFWGGATGENRRP